MIRTIQDRHYGKAAISYRIDTMSYTCKHEIPRRFSKECIIESFGLFLKTAHYSLITNVTVKPKDRPWEQRSANLCNTYRWLFRKKYSTKEFRTVLEQKYQINSRISKRDFLMIALFHEVYLKKTLIRFTLFSITYISI